MIPSVVQVLLIRTRWVWSDTPPSDEPGWGDGGVVAPRDYGRFMMALRRVKKSARFVGVDLEWLAWYGYGARYD